MIISLVGVRPLHSPALLLLLTVFTNPALAQSPAASTGEVPPLKLIMAQPGSELRDIVERFTADDGALGRRYDIEYSPERRARLRSFYGEWRAALRAINFDSLGQEGRIDYLLLENHLGHELSVLDRLDARFTEMGQFAPFAPNLMQLPEARRRLEPVHPAAVARTLATLTQQIDSIRKAIVKADSAPSGKDSSRGTRIVAYRTAGMLNDLRETLRGWYGFYSGYDPGFSWWVAEPYRRADAALDSFVKTLREKVVGIHPGEDDPIVGDPIGAAALRAELAYQMIPYTPEELVAIAEREFAWCEGEMRRAARDMGLGDDWRAALEKVKGMYVEPGEQPEMIHQLALEAIAFVEEHNLITVPPLAKEIWRMEMLSPEAQKVSPFFLGGEVIQVSYPTDSMANEEKMMTMRGNNRYFARATVQHELIPGHHLQGFMAERYQPQRRLFETPFYTEGWSLYWEMLLWDKGFPRTPEERIGMLFWRSHRAARIIFSLRFHLGTMTPQEAIDLLVNRVGHERANATAEVRRSFNGSYSPLYQAAYMIGGLQLRQLHRELVETGKLTDRQFHDAVLQGGNIPIELVRARLMTLPLTRSYLPKWRFDPGH